MSTMTDAAHAALEELDEPWPCDPPAGFGNCRTEASWAVVVSAKCGHSITRTLCHEHFRLYREQFSRVGVWLCVNGCITHDPNGATIERIEAL